MQNYLNELLSSLALCLEFVKEDITVGKVAFISYKIISLFFLVLFFLTLPFDSLV